MEIQNKLCGEDWFINPRCLSGYQNDYKRWIQSELNKPTSKLMKAISCFNNVDQCTIHAVRALTGLTDNSIKKKVSLGSCSWLVVDEGGYFSRSAVIAACIEEHSLLEKTVGIGKAALDLGVSYIALKEIRSSRYKESHRYSALLPLVELPISEKRRVCKSKLQKYLTEHGRSNDAFIKQY
ncbi:hypothetical protein GOP97_15055 [Vibrio cholerae]|uniref:hypothetical protein n=1 Tax=Vibrio cholerae TaxID=666 RepID=UPI002DB82F1F|nr:hypothetical protein [Vibrio cholerae]MEB5557084.1 hypothetical protein [Vibrio cholerae]